MNFFALEFSRAFLIPTLNSRTLLHSDMPTAAPLSIGFTTTGKTFDPSKDKSISFGSKVGIGLIPKKIQYLANSDFEEKIRTDSLFA